MTESSDSGRQVVWLATITYTALAAIGSTWLWWRGRLLDDAGWWFGDAGPLRSTLEGLLIGLSITAVFRLIEPLPVFSRLQAALAELLGPMTRWQCLHLAVMSGLAEELSFRFALQDVVGVWIAVTIFAALHIGPGVLLLWMPVAFAVGLLFAVLVERRHGLPAVAVAHAVTNYLSLRRMQIRWPQPR